MFTVADNSLLERVRILFATILPVGTRFTVEKLDDIDVTVHVAGTPLRVRFAGRGDFRGVQMAIKARPQPDVIAASRLSVAARQAIAKEGINWADEGGAASIEAGSIVIALSGLRPAIRPSSTDWTPAAIGIAEAILSGTSPTAEAVAAATGHSLSTAVRALAFLVERGLLHAPKARGPQSGRKIIDFNRLLDQFSQAVHQHGSKIEIRCGVLWREPFAEIKKIGQKWTTARVPWSVAGALAASIQAPYLTETPTGVVYVSAAREAEMLHVARQAGLEEMEGGRLLLRPFPTRATMRLIREQDGLWVTSWPRTYADLRHEGVRGEEAAEHLREVLHGD